MLKSFVFFIVCLGSLITGAALAGTTPSVKSSVNFADSRTMMELRPNLHPYISHAGKEPDGSAWYMLSAVNQADRPAARVIRAGQSPGAGLNFFPRRGKPAVLQVASSDAGVTVEPANAFGRHAFLVTVPPATSATIAIRILNAGTPPSVIAWTIPALVGHNRQLAIFLAAVAGLIAASIAITSGVAIMTSHLASRWAAITLVTVFLVELANGGMFDTGWMTIAGGPYGFSAMLIGLALAAGTRLADLIAPVSDVWSKAVPSLLWTQRSLLALCAAAFLGVPGAALFLQIAAVVGSAAIAVYLVNRGMHGEQAARVVAPSAVVFSLVALAAALVALGGFADNPTASAIVGGFAAAGAVLLALAISAGEGISILSGAHPPIAAPVPAARSQSAPSAIEQATKFGNSAVQAIGASHQGVFDLDFQRDVVGLSAEAASLLGFTRSSQSMPHGTWIARVHVDDREVYSRAMQDYRTSSGLAFRIEFRVRSESGRYPWFELRATMMGDGKAEAARCLGLIADVTTRKETEAAAVGRALHDQLTGLGNRVALMEELDQLGDGVGSAAFALLDIDRFKSIHASLGDEGGDEILAAVAKRLTLHLGTRAKVFRVGGDGFAILAPGLAASAAALGGELVDLCGRPFSYQGRDVFALASVGTVAGNDAEDPFILLKNAELALQLAKRQGGACSRLYSPDLEMFAQGDSVALESELRCALERNQLDVYYQPIIHLPDENVAGFEALLRWRHPERGVLMPEEFIAHAERTGLIVALGSFALDRAASALAEWQRYFPIDPPLTVSVNVSKRQICDPNFVAFAKSVLTEHQLAAGTLKFEITESAISTGKNAKAVVSELNALGIGIAIDDFGTGVSTLGQLREISFDTLKIDKSFLSAEGSGNESSIILNSIVTLAKDLKRGLIIEGVETEEDLLRVQAMGCEYAQGFYYSAPLSASDVLDFIARNYGTREDAHPSGASGVGG